MTSDRDDFFDHAEKAHDAVSAMLQEIRNVGASQGVELTDADMAPFHAITDAINGMKKLYIRVRRQTQAAGLRSESVDLPTPKTVPPSAASSDD